MNNTELIQALKDNKLKHEDLSTELQEAFLALSPEDLEFSAGWKPIRNPGYRPQDNETLRLRPDYEEKPGIVEWPINPDSGGTLCYEHPIEGIIVDKITEAVNQHDFIGFKYEDGVITAMPRRYKDERSAVWPQFHKGKTHEVLTPKAILFRSK